MGVVCAYAFPRKDLLEYKKNNKKTKLKITKTLKYLILQMSEKVQMIKMSDKSISIDTKKTWS